MSAEELWALLAPDEDDSLAATPVTAFDINAQTWQRLEQANK